MKQLIVLPAFLALTACGPLPLVQAEAQCRLRADQAASPSGSVGIGLGSDGSVETTLSLDITADYLAGRSPADVYNQCVLARSGMPPSRPYDALPPSR
jgi:hypothetical protein